MNTKFLDAVKLLSSSNIVLAKLIKEKLNGEEAFRDDKGKLWITPSGIEKLRIALEVPMAVPTKYRATCIQRAINPIWVYVKIDGKENKHLCLIPPKLRNADLVGKTFLVDKIEDVNGTTYRHEALGG